MSPLIIQLIIAIANDHYEHFLFLLNDIKSKINNQYILSKIDEIISYIQINLPPNVKELLLKSMSLEELQKRIGYRCVVDKDEIYDMLLSLNDNFAK
jgi:hypothetical protein